MRIFRALGKTLKWSLIVGALLIVVIVIVAVVSLGSASDKSEKSARQVRPSAWATLKIGTPAAQVRTMFGKPERTDSTEATGFKQTCWYYGVLASSGTYQVCFDGRNRVTAKTRF